MFMVFDNVRYCGEKLAHELGGKVGEIVRRIPTGGYVVDFGHDTYIVRDDNLVRYRYSDHEKGPEVMVSSKRRRSSEDDE